MGRIGTGPVLLLLLLLPRGLGASEDESVPCGTPVLSRVVGGGGARAGQWPWVVSVTFRGTHVCGGALIAPAWVLSAAHCFPPENPLPEYRVTLGTLQLLSPPPGAQVRGVAAVTTHPAYRDHDDVTGGVAGDLALARLDPPATPGRLVRPVCLPPPRLRIPPGTNCTVTGWGDVRTAGPLPPPKTLQQLQVPLLGRRRCRCLYRGGPGGAPGGTPGGTPARDTICAGFAEGRRDACQGDSGGPLSCLLGEQWLLWGVVSWGEGCGLPGRPGVYTRTATHTPWILGVVPEATALDPPPGPPRHDQDEDEEEEEEEGPCEEEEGSPSWSRPLPPAPGGAPSGATPRVTPPGHLLALGLVLGAWGLS